MADIIEWSAIEAECGDFRDGFVQTFRKYEGQVTDELDGAGRVVKVTIDSFARHTGIPRDTFRRWLDLKPEMRGAAARHLRAAKGFASKLEPEQKARLAEELLEDPDVAAQIRRPYDPNERTRPLPPEVSIYDRKRAEAAAGEIGARITRGFAKVGLALAADAYREVVDALRQAIADDAVDTDALNALDAIHDEYVIARHEAGFKVSV